MEANVSLQLRALNQTLVPNSKLQKLSVSFGDALQKIAFLRMSHADCVEKEYVKPTRELINDVSVKFTSKKVEDEAMREVEYQNARRDEEYYENLKNFSKSYLLFYEQAFNTMKHLDQTLKDMEERHSHVRVQRTEVTGEPIFGVLLENLKRPIPKEIEKLIDHIEANYLEKEGIFRIPGGLEVIKKMKTQLDSGVSFDEISSQNLQDKAFVMCGLLKLWVRDLPEPLLTINNFDECIAIAKAEDGKKRLDQLRILLDFKLPPNYKKVLGKLMNLFYKVSKAEQKNKMNAESLSVVFGMNILKPKKEDPNILVNNAKYINKITEICILNVDFLFNQEGVYERDRNASFRLEMSMITTKKSGVVPKMSSSPDPEGPLTPVKKDEELDDWLKENGNGSVKPDLIIKSPPSRETLLRGDSTSSPGDLSDPLGRNSSLGVGSENSDVSVTPKPEPKVEQDKTDEDLEKWLLE